MRKRTDRFFALLGFATVAYFLYLSFGEKCETPECLLTCRNLGKLNVLDDIRSPKLIANKHVRRVLIGNETFIIKKSTPKSYDNTGIW